jgi:hypothetical protein
LQNLATKGTATDLQKNGRTLLASEEDRNLPRTDIAELRLVSPLIEFEAAPIKSCTNDDRSAFCLNVASLAQEILSSTITWLNGENSIPELLKTFFLCNNISKISWVDFAKDVLSKTIKRFENRSSLKIKTDLGMVEAFIYKESRIEYFSVLILALHAHECKRDNFPNVLRKIANVFKIETSQTRKLKVLLTKILETVPRFLWTHKALPYVRLIQKNASAKECKNVLHASYNGLVKTSDYKEVYCADILTGLKTTDVVSWTKILNLFLKAKNWRVPRTAFLLIYNPTKSLLARTNFKQDKNLYESVYLAFASILELTGIVCTSDNWELLLKEEALLKSSEITDILLRIQYPPVNQELLSKILLGCLLSGTESEANNQRRMQLLNLSSYSNRLSSTILGMLTNSSVDFSEILWDFVHSIAEKEQTAEIHEQDIALIVAKLSNYTFKYSSTLVNLLTLLTTKKICSSLSFSDNCTIIEKHAMKRMQNSSEYYPTERYWSTMAFLAFNQTYESGKSLYPFTTCAWLIHRHRNKQGQVEVSKITEAFKSLVNASLKRTSKDHDGYAVLIIAFNEEFGDEPYFHDLRKFAIEEIFAHPKANLIFAPTYILSEVKHCVKHGVEVPRNLKYFLSDVEHWNKGVRFGCLSIMKELEQVLTETQKIFATGMIDLDTVQFAATLYFTEYKNDQFPSIPIFTQIAK